MALNIFLFIGSFCFMEFVAWSNHKYVMHGFLWSWHRDHHINDHAKQPKDFVKKRFEKNDLFFLTYAIPAIILILSGVYYDVMSALAIGLGITFYGFIYFLIHDVVYHKRLKIPFIQKNRTRYMKALVKAHDAHHNAKSAEDFKNFGLLIFQSRFLK